jgi:hypothetical protein
VTARNGESVCWWDQCHAAAGVVDSTFLLDQFHDPAMRLCPAHVAFATSTEATLQLLAFRREADAQQIVTNSLSIEPAASWDRADWRNYYSRLDARVRPTHGIAWDTMFGLGRLGRPNDRIHCECGWQEGGDLWPQHVGGPLPR